ncbi:rootletin-like isoform X2 [Symphalangus syndactylus]|uniref:rootletin-like isoform X2 n=1 Tax=Symphalangus syndactylus TaxID=9590 RepID=UPI003006FC74
MPPRAACGGSRASGPRPHRGAPHLAEAVHPAEALPRPADSSTLALIHSALHKRQLQVQDMRGRYEASRDLLGTLRKQLSDSESERRALEEQRSACGTRLTAPCRPTRTPSAREKSNLAHSLQVAQQQAEELWQEREKLQAAQEELRRQRDRLEEEQEDAVQDGAWVCWELQRSHRQLEQLEGKRSVLAKELVEVREALSHATLQRDMLQAEKAEVAEALTKGLTLQAEAGCMELELSMTKLRAEEASLQDSLSKLSAFNESLAQDKLDLNRLVAQLEEEKAALQGRQRQAEQEATVAREEQERLEELRLEQEVARQGLEGSLRVAEQAQEALEQQLPTLRHERSRLQEQLVQALHSGCQQRWVR